MRRYSLGGLLIDVVARYWLLLWLNRFGDQAGTFCPEFFGKRDRIDFLFVPPLGFVAGIMERAVMQAAERDNPLIAWLARQGVGLHAFVGPRPHAVAAKAAGQLYDEAVDQYAARHKVKPGITGWAQVNGWRGDTDTLEKLERRIDYDLYYIDNWSLWLDLKIIVCTITIVFGDKEAY